MTVTAEGIEEKDQQSGLIAKGCQLGQGFLFGKAMTAAEALRLCDQPAPGLERMRANGASAAN